MVAAVVVELAHGQEKGGSSSQGGSSVREVRSPRNRLFPPLALPAQTPTRSGGDGGHPGKWKCYRITLYSFTQSEKKRLTCHQVGVDEVLPFLRGNGPHSNSQQEGHSE